MKKLFQTAIGPPLAVFFFAAFPEITTGFNYKKL